MTKVQYVLNFVQAGGRILDVQIGDTEVALKNYVIETYCRKYDFDDEWSEGVMPCYNSENYYGYFSIHRVVS